MRVNMGREGRASSSLSANGGAMLGSLILANGPAQPLEAATKYYVDTVFASLNANNVLDGILPISSLPTFTGDATTNQGNNSFVLANLGVSPGSYPKVIVDAKGRVTGNDILTSSDIPNFDWNKVSSRPDTLAGYGITDALSTAGDTITGHLSVQNPTQSMSIVNKQYVDSALNNNSTVVGDIIRKPYATTPSGFLRCNGGLLVKTTYADLYATIGDSFSVNSIAGSGRPWEQQYQINDLQSGNISGWTSVTTLPYAVLYHKCVVTKNRIYLIGGGNAAGRFSTVYTAPINSDGTIGTWVASVSLPAEYAYFQTFVTKNYLYLIGGGTAATPALNTVYMAPINADGTLGTWTTSANLPVAINSINVVVLKNKVYVIGGAVNGTAVNTIYSANVNADGTLGTWSLYGTLPVTHNSSHLAVTKNRIYLIGGNVDSAMSNTIYTTTINTDGTLGSWVLAGTFPLNLIVACCVVTKNCIYIFGGAYTLNTYTANTYRANINADGTISSWEQMGNLPYVIGYSSAVIVKNRIYLLGGYINNAVSSTIMTAQISSAIQDYSSYYAETSVNYMLPGSGKPWRNQYQINETHSSVISGWTTSTALPNAVSSASAIVTKNRVYLCGGINVSNTVISTVYTAPINIDGTLGAWTTDTALPDVLAESQVIVTKNRVYLIGGKNNSSTLAIVYTAPINVDGTLGAWTTSTALPISLKNAQAFISKNRIYLLGGYNGLVYVSSIYSAVINTDGTLGNWVLIGENYNNNISGSGNVTIPAGITNITVKVKGANGSTAYSWTTTHPDVQSPSNNLSDPPPMSIQVYLRDEWGGTTGTAPINRTSYDLATGLLVYSGYQLPTITYTRVDTPVTGANSTFTINGNTYTGNGGVGGASTEQTFNITLPGTSSISGSHVIAAGGTGNVTYSYGSYLPISLALSQVIVTKNRAYLLGGYNGSANISTVYTAAINSEGTLGAWTTGTALPAVFALSQVFISKNRVHLIGGQTTSSHVATVYTAPINNDGTLGTWTTGTALPAALSDSQSIITKDHIYMIGGYNGSAMVGTIYTAPILEGLNDYTYYYDGSVVPLDAIVESEYFQLPDFTGKEKNNVNFYIKY